MEKDKKFKYILVGLILIIAILSIGVVALLVTGNQASEQVVIESNTNTGLVTKVVSDIFKDDLEIEKIGESLFVSGKTDLTKGEFEGLEGYTVDIKVVDKNGKLIDENQNYTLSGYFSGDVTFGMLDVANAEPYKVSAIVKDGTGKVVFTTEKIYR
ncbi:MAG: hypothetical protein ACRCVG_01240 [Methanobacteriaceae archaeon]